jgi:hypothetical protein
VTLPPVYDAGCTRFFGLIDGISVPGPTVVRTYVRNFGNQPINNFPVSYRPTGGAVVTQTYSGPPIAPGDSSLFTFGTQLNPTTAGPLQICAWADQPNDADATNDTVCVTVNVTVGIGERVRPTLQAYPDPATDVITFTGLSNGPAGVQLLDLSGREVRATNVSAANERLMLDVADLANGTYAYRITAGGITYAGRFQVAR